MMQASESQKHKQKQPHHENRRKWIQVARSGLIIRRFESYRRHLSIAHSPIPQIPPGNSKDHHFPKDRKIPNPRIFPLYGPSGGSLLQAPNGHGHGPGVKRPTDATLHTQIAADLGSEGPPQFEATNERRKARCSNESLSGSRKGGVLIDKVGWKTPQRSKMKSSELDGRGPGAVSERKAD